MGSKEDKKGNRLTGYSRLGWRLSEDGPPTNGTTRGRAEAMLSCIAQPLRSKSLRGQAVREDFLEEAAWNQYLKVRGYGSFTHCQWTISGTPRCQAGAWCKKVREGVVGQPSLTGAWAVSLATWASHFLSVGVCFFICKRQGWSRLMTGQAAGLEGNGNKERALSRGGTGFGIAERYWKETGEKQGQGRMVGS